MKRTPIKNLNDLASLRDQLKISQEKEKLEEQKRQADKLSYERTKANDADIFRRHTGDVTRIKVPNVHSQQRPTDAANPDKIQSKKITSMSEAMGEMAQWSDEFDASQQIDEDNEARGFSYAIKGSNPDLFRKLRHGQWPVQAFLDLHGLQRDQARAKLADFLIRSKRAKLRCVCIIHGKGIHSSQNAVLPSKVRSWLCQSELVQAFCPARPQDGGEGAVQVLLMVKPN